MFQSQLELALKNIDELLSDKNLDDKETMMALLLCECRALFTNGPLCTWVEESFKLFFKGTHTDLLKRTSHQEVKEAVNDVISMLVLEDKKDKK